jgi:hypothetical protein
MPRLLADSAVRSNPLGSQASADLVQLAFPGFALIDDKVEAMRPVIADNGA